MSVNAVQRTSLENLERVMRPITLRLYHVFRLALADGRVFYIPLASAHRERRTSFPTPLASFV